MTLPKANGPIWPWDNDPQSAPTKEQVDSLTTQLAQKVQQGSLFINVLDYGADNTGNVSKDSTTAIRNAYTACPNNGTLYFPAGAGYFITDTLTFDRSVNIIMDGKVNYNGTKDRKAVVIGKNTTQTDYLKLKLWLNSYYQGDWTNASYTGVQLQGISHSKIEITEINGFTIGLELRSEAVGSATFFNELQLGGFLNNQYAIKLTTISNGFVNANNFYGGFITGGTVNTSLSRYGIYTSSTGTHSFETLVFDGLRFGGFQHDYTNYPSSETVNMVLNNVVRSRFTNISMENANTGTFIRTTGTSSGNLIEVLPILQSSSVTTYNVDNQSTDAEPVVKMLTPSGANYYTGKQGWFPVYESGNLVDKFVQNSAGYGYIDEHCFFDINKRTMYRLNQSANYSLGIGTTDSDTAYLNMGDAGRIYDVSKSKTLKITTTWKTGQLKIVCFDANFNELQSPTTATYVLNPYFYWRITEKQYWNQGTGTTLYNTPEVVIGFTSAVKYVFIGFSYSSVVLEYKVESYGYATSSFTHYRSRPKTAKAIPTTGTWEQGDIIKNLVPTASGVIGWVCTTSGTLDSISTTCTADGSKVVTVASSTGISVGQYVTVNGTATKVTNVNGTSITLADAITSGSSLTFANTPAVLKTYGTISA
jgi:hypothetical protein